jgi:hypothetical protein
MTNISSMIQMLYRYALFVVMIIILLIMGLMFFYFTNQISYQNNKINAMFSIVTDLVQKDIQPLEIPLPNSLSPPNFEFALPQPGNLIEVSDSEDGESDDDDDDDDDDDECPPRVPIVFEVNDNEVKSIDEIQFIDISDVIHNTEHLTTDDIMVSDEKQVEQVVCEEELPSFDKTDDVITFTNHSDAKHQHHHHKTLHVNELRKMAVQLQLVQNVEAKKLKKDDLIDLLSKSSGVEAK